MGRIWRCIGHYNAETQAYSAAAGTFQTSPFTPDFNGRLVGIKLLEGHEAATSLQCDVQIRISCAKFTPNVMDFVVNGGGLKTVPVAYMGEIDYSVDQPIQAGVGITVEGRQATATAVTSSIIVMGCFEAST